MKTVTAGVLLAGVVAIFTVVISGPASAKADIAEAKITGPGLEGGLRIEAPDTEGLWESGIDVVGGLDDSRADSIEELGLTPADLGPRYLVTYRFGPRRDGRLYLIEQHLYPYAKHGPVTYTPPGQEVTAGLKMSITAGWYESSHPCRFCGERPLPPEDAALHFFRYLVDHGLPETNPVVSVASRGSSPDHASGLRAAPRAAIVALVGLATLLLAALAVQHRWMGAEQ